MKDQSRHVRWLSGAETLLNQAEQGLVALFLAILVGGASFQALLAVLFKLGWTGAGDLFSSTSWMQILLRHLALLTALLGASLATRQGRHLSIDAVSKLLPPRGRAALRSFLGLVSAATCGLLVWATWIAAQVEAASFSLGSVRVPVAGFLMLVLGCFALIGFRFVLRSGLDAHQAWTGELEPEAPPV